ncbi:MAG TPA: hypothetical protein VFW74_01270 [Acidimicrobiia bacterium]|nr:hypothetical protein [Acidimicrobiia bacterium]
MGRRLEALVGSATARGALLSAVRFAKQGTGTVYTRLARLELALTPRSVERDWRFSPERTPELSAILEQAESAQPVWNPGMVADHLRGLFGAERVSF